MGQQGHYPFGESWYASSTTTKWQFTSYERDSESTLDYAMFRYDNSRLGRFMTPDPIAGSISNPQSLNRYAYVLNDPVNLVDPLGLSHDLIFMDEMSSTGGTYGFFALLSSGAEYVPNSFVGFFINSSGSSSGTDHDLDGGGGRRTLGQKKIAAVVNQALQQSDLADCLNQERFFGPGTILTNQNLPFLDTRVSQPEIERRTLTPGAQGTYETPVPATGRGTALIPTNLFYDPNSTMGFLSAKYIHEVGNILSIQRFGSENHTQALDPKIRRLDSDSGAALEECVFGGIVRQDGTVFPP